MNTAAPLADRIRPSTLGEVVGQSHLIGVDKPLSKIVETGNLFSIIFWGPPGIGKTTLARIISSQTGAHFVEYSAVAARKADVMAVVGEARERLKTSGRRTILFIDEIHRFTKAQQDAFLPFVEDGTIVLFGATTENPSFEIISPLLSRARVFVLEPLSAGDLSRILKRGAKEISVELECEAEDFLVAFANGDARKALNLMEETARLYKEVSQKTLAQALQSKFLRYDRVGDEHYDTISAFIKSMRASNADAALYYLARMVAAGEDPLFIARRLVVFASEDVGMAQSTALVVANEVFRACETIGLPECQENLAHGAVYLSKAPKDRSAYDAYMKALADVKEYGNLPIPLKIRNAPTRLMRDLGYSKGYEKYTRESFLPDVIRNHTYFTKIHKGANC
ncbi:MAG: replication-associated recombination protein A [Patescibacteria group bacterium]|nr:replication-associated recombination protein A [Patescibacteria group bacterium]